MNKGGYSGIGMLPVYVGFTTLLIALIPVLGPLASFLLVLFASMSTAIFSQTYFSRERSNQSRFDVWRESKKSIKTVTKRNPFYIPRALRHNS